MPTQLRLVAFLKSYINDPKNEMEVIPANVGLADEGLSSLIVKYNDLLIERKRLLRTSNESNPAVVQLDAGIRATRANVQTTVDNVEKGLLITQSDLDREGRKFCYPHQQRAYTREGIDEHHPPTGNQGQPVFAVTAKTGRKCHQPLASTATNGRIIEEAMAGSAPVSPNKKIFYLIALILGIGIPVGVIYLRNLLPFPKLKAVPMSKRLPMYR